MASECDERGSKLDLSEFTDRLDKLITNVHFDGAGGVVLVPERPVELEPLLLPGFPDYDPEASDPLYVELADELGIQPALSFEWGGAGRPMSWFAELEYLELNGCAYVYAMFEPERELPWQVLAKIAPSDHRGGWSAFIRELFASNGTTFGIELFASRPDRVTNDRPDRIDEEALEQSLKAWTPIFRSDLE